MKNNVEVLTVSAALVVAILLGIGGWKVKRWANWKFSYGAKVEQKIVALEKRIEALEAGK